MTAAGRGARFVVCGPPGSGKSSWVRQRAQPGDLVWDFDAVAATIGNLGVPLTRRSGKWIPWPTMAVTLAMRDGFVTWLEQSHMKDASVYLIVTDHLDARRIAKTILAELVTLPATEPSSS